MAVDCPEPQELGRIDWGDIDILSNVTLFIWARFNHAETSGQQASIACLGDRAGSDPNYAMSKTSTDGGDEIRFYINNGGWSVWSTTDMDFTVGEWTGVCVKYDNTNKPVVFSNDTEATVGTATIRDMANNNNQCMTGRDAGHTTSFEGQLAFACLWQEYFGDAQMKALSKGAHPFAFTSATAANNKLLAPMQDLNNLTNYYDIGTTGTVAGATPPIDFLGAFLYCW